MTPLVWTRRAVHDVQAIQQFIARDSPQAAQLVTQQLVAVIDRLPLFPRAVESFPKQLTPIFVK